MSLEQNNFDAVTVADLEALIESGAPEGRTLEYKSGQYTWDVEPRERSRSEFAKDVSAMANTVGGHLIIGMRTADGAASKLVGMAGLDADAEIRRMDEILQGGVQPRLYGVRIRNLRLADGNQVLLLRIPRSANAPHRVAVNQANRFYLRNSAGCYEASVEDLKMLFSAGSDFQDRFQNLVDRRLEAVANMRVNVNLLPHQGFAVLHIVPLNAFSKGGVLDPEALAQLHNQFRPLGAANWASRVNFDGRVFYREGPVCHGYTQVYRNGTVEAVKAGLVSPMDAAGARRLNGTTIIEDLVFGIRSYFSALRQIGVDPPFLAQITLLDVGGATLVLRVAGRLDGYRDDGAPQPLHPQSLMLPWFEVADYVDDAGYDALVRPAMDALANAGGLPRCPYYNADGQFVRPPAER